MVQFFGDASAAGKRASTLMGSSAGASGNGTEHRLRKIADEAAERFGLRWPFVCITALVSVAVGETSLFLRVAAARRGAAFDASRWIVDELKKRVPV